MSFWEIYRTGWDGRAEFDSTGPQKSLTKIKQKKLFTDPMNP